MIPGCRSRVSTTSVVESCFTVGTAAIIQPHADSQPEISRAVARGPVAAATGGGSASVEVGRG